MSAVSLVICASSYHLLMSSLTVDPSSAGRSVGPTGERERVRERERERERVRERESERERVCVRERERESE